MSERQKFITAIAVAQIVEKKGKIMSKFKWTRGSAAPWGKDVEVRTPRGEAVYKDPSMGTIFATVREALYCGRLDLWGETPTFDEQLDLMRDVLSLIERKVPITAIAAKLFGSNQVLLDFYLSWLRSHFLAHRTDDPDQWALSAEANSILLMLQQVGAAAMPAPISREAAPEQPKATRRRRIMMEMCDS